MISLYKSTSKVTGGAASFKVALTGGVFAEVLKQKSWDAATKKGSFDTTNKIAVFLNEVELSTMLRVLNGKLEEFKTVHVQKGGIQTGISLTKWEKTDTKELMGFGFSVNRAEKRWSVSLGLNEAELFRQFLTWALQKTFEANMVENLKKSKANSGESHSAPDEAPLDLPNEE